MLNTWRILLDHGAGRVRVGPASNCFTTSCSNAYLVGTYNGQIGNGELLTALGAGVHYQHSQRVR